MCDCKTSSKFKDLDRFIETQNNDEAALIPVLHKAQELYGYVSEETQVFIAKRLGIPPSQVYGVVTFYSYFSTKPKGKFVVSVCTGTACFVRGAGDILQEFKSQLSIKEGETTENGLFTLDTLRCVGACGIAPVVSINNKVYGHFSKSEVINILRSCEEFDKDGEHKQL
ncbi:complex I 24 kDa subunit family protein [Clostridium intestinale]|uniref:Hydrogenase, electron-transfer subunit n=1 Tax=Clostridium intestinale URNW TaxID=1294142 RepID=U2MZZ4_9CLOT|nr:NAD(P)H-dependent oxidoreductase subunit E [Clostridium intestinale]ERK28822.1 hydrogenase, electron-transfer subunit [Clostridium intestinale URNW]